MDIFQKLARWCFASRLFVSIVSEIVWKHAQLMIIPGLSKIMGHDPNKKQVDRSTHISRYDRVDSK